MFQNPVRYISAASSRDLPAFFSSIENALHDGYYIAGYFTYEAGAHLLGLPAHSLREGECLAKFGVYDAPQVFDHLAGERCDVKDRGRPTADISLALMPTISREQYFEKLDRIQQLIAAGDTYQVNFTHPLQSRFAGGCLDLYERMSAEQPSSYSAIMRLDAERTVLSFSPELFFATSNDGHIVTRPMKGTSSRGNTAAEDAEAARALRLDEKNRAEHVMIVDLLRNDLGRICATGSVRVDNLFHVEAYPAVHQMVSTVTGKLRRNLTWREIFTSIFPSGSITGAPKRRTMEIIHELEEAPRGIYTGAIGYIAPSSEAAFSVAIRTMEVRESPCTQTVTMGVGGGIVADSTPAEEWKECVLKTSFAHRGSESLHLIETMLVKPCTAEIPRLALHLSRLGRSAATLGFEFDEKQLRQSIAEHCVTGRSEAMRIRLTLSRTGEVQTSAQSLLDWPRHLRVRMCEERTDPNDPSLRHKTTFRRQYDQALQLARHSGFDECLFLNTRGELTEGCVTNLVLSLEGELRTPSLDCGVLPGVFRQSLIERGLLSECVLPLDSLRQAEAVFLCNSVRGLVPVESIRLTSGETLRYSFETANRIFVS